jgi:hypothetical protein
MSALVASDTRSPFSASSEISACTDGDPEPGRDEERAELVAVRRSRVGLVVDSRSADVAGG